MERLEPRWLLSATPLAAALSAALPLIEPEADYQQLSTSLLAPAQLQPVVQSVSSAAFDLGQAAVVSGIVPVSGVPTTLTQTDGVWVDPTL